jgi:hypothetical protein
LFIKQRSAPSCCQPLQFNPLPRGARIASAKVVKVFSSNLEFALAFVSAVALAFLSVIPEGNLLLRLPQPLLGQERETTRAHPPSAN